MNFLEMDQSAKPGEKWRRRFWVLNPASRRTSTLYISPAGKPGDGWTLFGASAMPIKMEFVDHELSADDWEKFEWAIGTRQHGETVQKL